MSELLSEMTDFTDNLIIFLLRVIRYHFSPKFVPTRSGGMDDFMANTAEYYLSKGFDLPTARYYAAGRRKIISVYPNDDFTLTLAFDNGEQRIFDIKPMLIKGTVFEPFCDILNFKRVYLDEQHCVSWDIDPNVNNAEIWNNKVNLCPDSCYIDSVPIVDASRC